MMPRVALVLICMYYGIVKLYTSFFAHDGLFRIFHFFYFLFLSTSTCLTTFDLLSSLIHAASSDALIFRQGQNISQSFGNVNIFVVWLCLL